MILVIFKFYNWTIQILNVLSANLNSRPSSAPVSTILSAPTETLPEGSKDGTNSDVTLQLKKLRSDEDKGKLHNTYIVLLATTIYDKNMTYLLLSLIENEKDNDRSGSQATQALIQRRRRPKRRSTGVCNVGGEENENERQESPVDGEEVSGFYTRQNQVN